MLDHRLPPIFRHKFLYIPWIPEFGRNAQILAAAHERVRLAAFGGGRDTVRVEVLLFSSSNAY